MISAIQKMTINEDGLSGDEAKSDDASVNSQNHDASGQEDSECNGDDVGSFSSSPKRRIMDPLKAPPETVAQFQKKGNLSKEELKALRKENKKQVKEANKE